MPVEVISTNSNVQDLFQIRLVTMTISKLPQTNLRPVTGNIKLT